MSSCDGEEVSKEMELSKVKQNIVLEYVQRGVVSPRQIKEIRATYGLSHPQTEKLVSDLIARGVCILEDDRLEHVRRVQTSVFYQNRQRCNSLLNEMPLSRLMAAFLILPDTQETIAVSSFHSLPNWRQYLRDLSRLQMITAGEEESELLLSDGFQHVQSTVHTYLEKGYVRDLQYSWRRAARADVVGLAQRVCQSPFFSSVVLPVIRQYCLSLPEIRHFVSWISECPAEPASMHDIVRYAVNRGELREVWWLLLATSSSWPLAAIQDGSDVCFSCLRMDRCTPRFRGQYNEKAIGDLLLEYRCDIAPRILRKLEKDEDRTKELIPDFARDSMLLKFAISCRVVKSAKRLLQDVGILERSAANVVERLRTYCPQHDLWSLSDSVV